MNDAALEKLAEIHNRLENITAAMSLAMPPDMHLSCLRESMPLLSADIKNIYLELGGEDYWSGQS